MTDENLPPTLQTRILSYFDYCYQRTHKFPFNNQSIMQDLSPSLQNELTAYLNKDLIARVPFFRSKFAEPRVSINCLNINPFRSRHRLHSIHPSSSQKRNLRSVGCHHQRGRYRRGNVFHSSWHCGDISNGNRRETSATYFRRGVLKQYALFDYSSELIWIWLSDYFGELSVLLNSRRTATVSCMTFCELYSLHKRDLEKILLGRIYLMNASHKH